MTTIQQEDDKFLYRYAFENLNVYGVHFSVTKVSSKCPSPLLTFRGCVWVCMRKEQRMVCGVMLAQKQSAWCKFKELSASGRMIRSDRFPSANIFP
jgi:hypothetical protein